jgi:hypothetical protein
METATIIAFATSIIGVVFSIFTFYSTFRKQREHLRLIQRISDQIKSPRFDSDEEVKELRLRLKLLFFDTLSENRAYDEDERFSEMEKILNSIEQK